MGVISEYDKKFLDSAFRFNLEAELRSAYKRHLVQHDVQWPGGQKLIGLLFLYYNIGKLVTKDRLTIVVRFLSPGSGDYQDGRHLADMGWDICSTNTRFSRGRAVSGPPGCYCLGSVEHPNPVWMSKAKVKRRGSLRADTWNELLMLYREHGCAVCGQKAPPYDRGHLDPTKPPEVGNIVPMCVDCNQWAQAHGFSFKLFGMVARPICLACATKSRAGK